MIVAGATLTAAGFAWFSLLTPTTSWAAGILGPGIAVSLGMGIVFPAVTTAATSGVDGSLAGLVSGLVTTSRQIGGAVGLSVLSTLAAAHTATLTAEGAPAPVASTVGHDARVHRRGGRGRDRGAGRAPRPGPGAGGDAGAGAGLAQIS